MTNELLGVAFLLAAAIYSITRIRYTIDDQYLRVVWFRFTVRKIALSDIEDVHTHWEFWNEHWANTL